jgi:hypothetical protein
MSETLPRGLPGTTDPLGTPLAAFVRESQRMPVFQGITWADPVWDITPSHLSQRSHSTRNFRLLFTQHAGSRTLIKDRTLFEPAFADLAKACIVRRQSVRPKVPPVNMVFLRAMRYVYDACPLPARRDPTRLTREHFVGAENAVLAREKRSTPYRIGQRLEEFGAMLDRHALTRSPIDYRCSIRRPKIAADRTDAAFQERVDALLSGEELDALADIGNRNDLLPFDLLRMRAAELMLIGGFRVGEAFTLPKSPIVREPIFDDAGSPRLDAVSGKPIVRIGLRYWPEKNGLPIVKWIPTIAQELVERAIADIDRLCAKAREVSSWLELHPGDVNLGVADDAILSKEKVRDLLGLCHINRVTSWLKTKKRAGTGWPNGERGIVAADLKMLIARDRFDKPAVVRKDGVKQQLSESLFVILFNDGHAGRPTNRFIAAPLTEQHMSAFLGGDSHVQSIFDRYGYTEPSGKRMRAKSHDFRKVINTMAQRGGLSQVEIARWMGRSHIGDNVAYDYRTASELAAELRELVMKNEVYGDLAKQVAELPPGVREPFLKKRLSMGHSTPNGDCSSNVAETPCATALSCLGGCTYYLRRKNDQKSRDRLLVVQSETEVLLAKANEAEDAGMYNAANWVNAQRTVLRTIHDALAIDDDPEIADGAFARVSPSGPNLGKPV